MSEFGLNMVTGTQMLLQQEDLNQVDKFDFEPHIYFICRRSRITLAADSVKFTEKKVTGEFKKQIKDQYISIPFEVDNHLSTSEVTLVCDYPYTEYEIRNKAGNAISNGKCALLLGTLGPEFWKHLDLEVLYVGQAYGKDGSRNASDRLQCHTTLQGIYAEAIRKSPDQDIWLIVSSFEPLLLCSFDGRSQNYLTTDQQDSDHMKEVVDNDMTEQQQINFTEAALIKYFRPPYNKEYKDTFPNPAHSTYSECYDIDLNMVCVEVQTEDLMLGLWSEKVDPSWIHFCSFPLHSREDRVYMFELDGQDII